MNYKFLFAFCDIEICQERHVNVVNYDHFILFINLDLHREKKIKSKTRSLYLYRQRYQIIIYILFVQPLRYSKCYLDCTLKFSILRVYI